MINLENYTLVTEEPVFYLDVAARSQKIIDRRKSTCELFWQVANGSTCHYDAFVLGYKLNPFENGGDFREVALAFTEGINSVIGRRGFFDDDPLAIRILRENMTQSRWKIFAKFEGDVSTMSQEERARRIDEARDLAREL